MAVTGIAGTGIDDRDYDDVLKYHIYLINSSTIYFFLFFRFVSDHSEQ